VFGTHVLKDRPINIYNQFNENLRNDSLQGNPSHSLPPTINEARIRKSWTQTNARRSTLYIQTCIWHDWLKTL